MMGKPTSPDIAFREIDGVTAMKASASSQLHAQRISFKRWNAVATKA